MYFDFTKYFSSVYMLKTRLFTSENGNGTKNGSDSQHTEDRKRKTDDDIQEIDSVPAKKARPAVEEDEDIVCID